MPISIAGSGTITGISAGGLPDDCITTAEIAAGAVTDAKVNASAAIADSKLSGTTCKAWVNFNGTGTVAIRASYNVSSITDHGVGEYTVNFTTALADANYSAVGSCGVLNVAQGYVTQFSLAASSVRFKTGVPSADLDLANVFLAIFR